MHEFTAYFDQNADHDTILWFDPQDEVMRQPRPFLPALAVASVGKGHAFWSGIVNLETALGRLIADFDDTLLRLLADPQRTIADLDRRELTESFFKLVTTEFGIPPPEPGQEDAWADRFTAFLCLVETYASAGDPAGFPFADVLPQRVYWERCRGFLRKWQHHDLFKPAFRQRAKSIDAQYPLGSWAAALASPSRSSTFLNVEQALWKATQKELAAIRSKAEAVEFARERQAFFQDRAEGFWSREGDTPGCGTARLDAALIRLLRHPRPLQLHARGDCLAGDFHALHSDPAIGRRTPRRCLPTSGGRSRDSQRDLQSALEPRRRRLAGQTASG